MCHPRCLPDHYKPENINGRPRAHSPSDRHGPPSVAKRNGGGDGEGESDDGDGGSGEKKKSVEKILGFERERRSEQEFLWGQLESVVGRS